MSAKARDPDKTGKRKFTAQAYAPKPIPPSGLVRLPSILAVYPVSRTSWLDGVKSGKYPAPVKLSARTVAWKAEDIHALINEVQA